MRPLRIALIVLGGLVLAAGLGVLVFPVYARIVDQTHPFPPGSGTRTDTTRLPSKGQTYVGDDALWNVAPVHVSVQVTRVVRTGRSAHGEMHLGAKVRHEEGRNTGLAALAHTKLAAAKIAAWGRAHPAAPAAAAPAAGALRLASWSNTTSDLTLMPQPVPVARSFRTSDPDAAAQLYLAIFAQRRGAAAR